MALVLQTGDFGVDLIALAIVLLICYLISAAVKADAGIQGALKWGTIVCFAVGLIIFFAELILG